MNITESRGENCQDIIYDVLENDLKINVDIFVSMQFTVLANLKTMGLLLLALARSSQDLL